MRNIFRKACPVIIAAILVLQLSPLAFAEEVLDDSLSLDPSDLLQAGDDSTDNDATIGSKPIEADSESDAKKILPEPDEKPTSPKETGIDIDVVRSEKGSAPSPEELESLAINALTQEVETQDPAELGYIPGQLLVTYKNEVSEEAVDNALDMVDGELDEVVAEYDDTTLASVNIPGNVDAEAIAEVVEQDDRILIAEPNYLVTLSDTPAASDTTTVAENDELAVPSVNTNDTYASRLWHLDYIQAQKAWSVINSHFPTNKILVAVIDTGANLDHQDLSGIINKDLSCEIIVKKTTNSDGTTKVTTTGTQKLQGDGVLNGDTSIRHTTGHGTHVAGIIAANANNGAGVAGVGSAGNNTPKNPIEIVAIDAFSSGDKWDETSTSAEITYALKLAKEKGCKVANLSLEFGRGFSNKTLENAVNDFTNNGGVVVAAAGNGGANQSIYPGAYKNTIGVMASTTSGGRLSSSNYGSSYDLYAPGDGIYSTIAYPNNNSYGHSSGTSMAAPMVTATVAMMYAVSPTGMNLSTARSILKLTTNSKGVLNTYKAVSLAAGEAAPDVLGDYKYIYDYDSYLKFNPNLGTMNQGQAFMHFLSTGMSQGLQGSDIFNPQYYRNAYGDLRNVYGANWTSYYNHFINNGMKEGRRGSNEFSLVSYYNAHPDLRSAFGLDPARYYRHYIDYGKHEGRRGTGHDGLQGLVGGTSKLNGKDYSAVYDSAYYIANNADVAQAYTKKLGIQQVVDDTGVLRHFVDYGMKEGRRGNASFDYLSYYYANADLRAAYGLDPLSYYNHYMNYGKKEGRTATGVTALRGNMAKLNGKDYSAVYDSAYYIAANSDVARTYTKKFGRAYVVDEAATLRHFVNYGMREGRASSPSFNYLSYYYRYPDLRAAYGLNPISYYNHYMNYGKKEGRIGTGTFQPVGAVTKRGNTDYSVIYDYTYYVNHNADIAKAYTKRFGKTYVIDESAVLNHFISYGMKEGRASSPNFSWSAYQNNYTDLQNAYGDDKASYYIHYMKYGQKEGRTAI